MTPVTLVKGLASLLLLVVMALQLHKCKLRAEPVSYMIVGLHGVIYFLVIAADYQNGRLENPALWNYWSGLAMLHLLFTVIVNEYFRLLRIRRDQGDKHCGP